MTEKKYPAKLLLFGEYTILVGSRALAIPVPRWSGKWTDGNNMDSGLGPLVDYLRESGFGDHLNIEDFANDVRSGLRFESSIPWGYGLGSSAALTAAVFDKYSAHNDKLSLTEIIEKLASIEGFYHNHSSGLDPLVSYLNKPVLHENNGYHAVDLVPGKNLPQIFLINSGIARFTAPLVAIFKSRLEEADYVAEVINPLKVNVDHAIDNFLSGSWDMFWDYLHLISEIQFNRFREMLPEPIEHIWKRIDQNPDMCLKLCGAGGGGYFLGFARPGIDVEKVVGCAVEMIENIN